MMTRNIGILILVVLLLSFIVPFITSRLLYKEMFNYLEQKDYEAFENKLDGFLCRISFRPFNREFLRLNSYFLQEDSKSIDRQIDFLLNCMKLNDEEKNVVINKGFNYYLIAKNKKRCKLMLNNMETISKDEIEFRNNRMLYDVMLDKKFSYIKEIENLLRKLKENNENNSKDMQIGIFEYLLGLQFKYKNDLKEMTKHFNESLKYCKNTVYEKEILKYMKNN